jgi:hypothetical protein
MIVSVIWSILKKAWPFLLAAGVGAYGYFEGNQRGFTKGYSKAIKDEIVKIEIPKCPDCNCPDIPPSNGIEFDKIKGFKGTISLTQHYRVDVNGDSLVMRKFEDVVKAQLKELKVSRCK